MPNPNDAPAPLSLDPDGKFRMPVAPERYFRNYSPVAFQCTAPVPDSRDSGNGDSFDSGPAVIRVEGGNGWFQSLVLSVVSALSVLMGGN